MKNKWDWQLRASAATSHEDISESLRWLGFFFFPLIDLFIDGCRVVGVGFL